MYNVTIDGETCDGSECLECIEGCPVEMLDLVSYVSADSVEKQISGVITDMDECIGCMACESVCPTESIKVMEL